LQQALDLPEPPLRIECYDISTLQGTNTVGSMVVLTRACRAKAIIAALRFKMSRVRMILPAYRKCLRRRFKRMADEGYRAQKLAGGELTEDENSWALSLI